MYKTTFVIAIVVISVNTALALPGSGTQEDPWRIESPADFNEFAADPNYWYGWTRLETDVNLAGKTYSTAVIAPDTDNSNYGFDGTAFTGVFDGNGHNITALTIDDGGAGNWYLGLFGYNRGEVRNLSLKGGSVSGSGRLVGGLVGRNSGSISNCYSTGDVSVTGNVVQYVGGLVGGNGGSVSNCNSTGDVSGDYFVGGLVGRNGGSISNCYSTGDVSGNGGVGGLVGKNRGSVSNCYSTGSVRGDHYVGGLVGKNLYYANVSSCYSTGSVRGDDCVGGLVGDNWYYASVSNCYSTGDVRGVHYVGGLVGWNYYYSSASNCYSTGDVSGDRYVGGLVGSNAGTGRVSNCYSTGDVSGERIVGGLVGSNAGTGRVSNCFWDIETQTHGVTKSIGRNLGRVKNVKGLHTAEMQMQDTFTSAGWDFVGETANGTDDIWLICQGRDYPRLWWQFQPPALKAEPQETIGTSNVIMWSEVSDANAYWVECAEDANFQYLVDTSGWISQTSYVFFGLETGVTYWYRVKASYYCDIESWWSNVESSTQVRLADAVLARLDANDLKNKNMLRSLANKLDAIQGMMDKGQYKAAISKLENDILQKTDGCAETGAPDKNDWIITCDAQQQVYQLIRQRINYLKSLAELEGL